MNFWNDAAYALDYVIFFFNLSYLKGRVRDVARGRSVPSIDSLPEVLQLLELLPSFPEFVSFLNLIFESFGHFCPIYFTLHSAIAEVGPG